MPSLHSTIQYSHSKFIYTLNLLTNKFIGPSPPGFPPIPPYLFRTSIDLLTKTLLVTKTSSHITFLGGCIRKHLIPNGFRVDLQLHNCDTRSSGRVRAIERQASQQLLRTQLRFLRHFRYRIKPEIGHLKAQLRLFCTAYPYLFLNIIEKIRFSNKLVYSHLRDTKYTKFSKLLAVKIAAPPEIRQRVFVIPEDLPLLEEERSVLSRGLSFVPSTLTPDVFQVRREAEQFFRTLRLRAFFNLPTSSQATDDQSAPDIIPNTDTPRDILSTINPNPSRFIPPMGRFAALDTYISTCRRLISDLNLRSDHKNLSTSEMAALRSLRNRDDIVIKPADKGGAVVVWRRDLYEQECYRQLNDPSCYTALDSDPTSSYQDSVVKFITDSIRNGDLPPQAKRLIVDYPRTPVFYCLPKIHKQGYPGRPIVSACSCPTEHISAYVDAILQPIVQTLPSFIKDTNHLLHLLSNVCLPDTETWLVTFDVTSLYTVIPHDAGLDSLRYFLDLRSDLDPPTDIVLGLASLVLKLTGFAFHDRFFKQTCGISMGSKMGPSFANLFVGFAENNLFSNFPNLKPTFYGRFIDDGLIIYNGKRSDLDILIDRFTHLHPALDLNFLVSGFSVNFLDVSIFLSEHQIHTKLYEKPTNAYNFLRYDSCHPIHTKKAIPYSQFLRLRRICSSDDDFNSQAESLKIDFQLRGYPIPLLDASLAKAFNASRTFLKSANPTSLETKIPAVFTYHPSLMSVSSILRDNYNLLRNDTDTGPIFSNKRLIFSYKKQRNLKSILVHSNSSIPPTPMVAGTYPCGRPRCKTCPFVTPDTVITTPNSSFSITGRFSCINHNVIYCISCRKCPNIHYIGESQNKLSERFTQHRFDIRHNVPSTGVSRHFNLSGHNVQDITIRVVKVICGPTSVRRLQENKLIFRLGTEVPSGMNDKPRFNI